MKLKRKTKSGILISVLIILILSLLYNKYLSHEAYLKRVSGVNLPFWTVTNETESKNLGVIGKFEIPESKVEEFISENNLKGLLNSDVRIGYDNILKEKNRVKNTNGRWFAIEDCKSGNNWKILLNSQSGDLWILVRFPDWSGDSAPCD
jgi:hypothetical protein